jgi:hypothetical protein
MPVPFDHPLLEHNLSVHPYGGVKPCLCADPVDSHERDKVLDNYKDT